MTVLGPARGKSAKVDALRELRGLRDQIDNARGELTTLLGAITGMCHKTHDIDTSDLAAATNANLLVALLDSQAETANVARVLDHVARSADHDDLTGLPSRTLMLDRLSRAMAQARRTGTHVGVLFIDLDNFKAINDSHGHATGDEVLQHVAAAITDAVRDSDTVSRHGGDEFLVVLPDIASASDAAVVADHVNAALRRLDLAVPVSGSIGISVYPGDGDEPALLIEQADRAMYAVKQSTVHGGAARTRHASAAVTPTPNPALDPTTQAQLQEANACLLQAALDAQQMQSAAEYARRQLADFMAVLSHELRNPLAPIRNAAALLDRVAPDQLPRLQALIERQVVHLQRLTGDLLDIARVDVGKLRLDLGPLDLSTVLGESIDGARTAIDARGQRFEVDVAPVLRVQGDSIRLQQMFGNLLDNASKYTPVGGCVCVRAQVCPLDPDAVRVTINDSGIGISSDVLAHVFDPYVQEAHAIGFDNTGLGIGLAVVRELVRAHGGTIAATSAGTGRGSEFTITLPRLT